MNKENFPMSFPGHDKLVNEAHKINEGVEDYYERPRTNKDRSADDVASEIIKKGKSEQINLSGLSKEERQWYENMQSAGIRLLNDGFLEISRWDNTGKHFGNPKLIRQKVEGINSAIRMQDHILGQYRSDKKGEASKFSKIESIQEVIEQANGLLNNWSKLKPKEKERMQIQLADVILQLENCRNEFIVVAKNKLETIVQLKDSKGRENPGALAAKTVSAMNNLAKRINEMQLIMPSMALRKELLILEKRRIGKASNKAGAYLRGFLNHVIFKDNFKKSTLSNINPSEIEELKRKLGKVLYLLDSVHTSPYFEQAEQAKFYINNGAKKYFTSKNNFIENLPSIKDGAQEAIKVLKSNMEQFE